MWFYLSKKTKIISKPETPQKIISSKQEDGFKQEPSEVDKSEVTLLRNESSLDSFIMFQNKEKLEEQKFKNPKHTDADSVDQTTQNEKLNDTSIKTGKLSMWALAKKKQHFFKNYYLSIEKQVVI